VFLRNVGVSADYAALPPIVTEYRRVVCMVGI
jgi:hypothetical protein